MGKIFPLPSSLEPRTSNLEPQHQSAKSVKSFQSPTLLVAELSSSLAKCYKQRRKVYSGESALVLYSPQVEPNQQQNLSSIDGFAAGTFARHPAKSSKCWMFWGFLASMS